MQCGSGSMPRGATPQKTWVCRSISPGVTIIPFASRIWRAPAVVRVSPTATTCSQSRAQLGAVGWLGQLTRHHLGRVDRGARLVGGVENPPLPIVEIHQREPDDEPVPGCQGANGPLDHVPRLEVRAAEKPGGGAELV